MLMGGLQLHHIFTAKKRASHILILASASLSTQGRIYSVKKCEEPEHGEEELSYSDVPRAGKKWERKPFPTPMKELIRRAKQEKRDRQENPCRVLEHAPENGLLIPHLIQLAHGVYNARETLLHGLFKLVESDGAIPVRKCRFCSEVYIGHHGHEIRSCEGPGSASRNAYHVWRRGGIKDVVGFPYCYHLFDRVGKPRVGHKERFQVPKLPAITELCIQAGLDLDEYPTKRRTKPVYSIEGRIVDFEPENEEDKSRERSLNREHLSQEFEKEMTRIDINLMHPSQKLEEEMTRTQLSTNTLQAWLEMKSGAIDLMKEYSVITCGYCPEVQVGPKGHKVRMCKAAKHQFRDGQHAWQEATIDDLLRPNHVWHVRNPQGPPLANELKRYYGKAPAVVELCVQNGAPVPNQYRSMMRLDVVPPDLDEHDLVA
ncbi:APO protein 3, mitochondrial [Iris pallida]|uniref:APO protein 3, mitochondrial n=1 Tax=Iris pallida TaxID=29817 RepID=A0AAX6FAW4_IRIPA|nr:APO protein 3, mitochondrial [Iris pallida]